MDLRANILALCLLDALEDENENMLNNIMDKYDVDPTYVQPERGISPLHYSCGMTNYEVGERITRRFMKSASDVNVRSDENMTPLHVAAMYGRIEIVKLLLENSADLNIQDNERKTPVMYAVEECHFEVVQLMRDYIFLKKYELRKQVQRAENQVQKVSTPSKDKYFASNCPNKNLLAVTEVLNEKYTPNRTHYNYDVTSPYYINITHRRNKPQPAWPAENTIDVKNDELQVLNGTVEQVSVTSNLPESINIFSLTKDNMKQLSNTLSAAERSRLSLIETWREKVHRSRTRDSIKQFDDIKEMIDTLVQNDSLNFTNTVLRNSSKRNLDIAEVESGACRSESIDSLPNEDTKYSELPQNLRHNISLGALIQKVAQAKIVDTDPVSETEISFKTVPEMTNINQNNLPVPPGDNISYSVPAARNSEYFLQMTEAYVHADDENGLVFYETKLLSNNPGAQEINCSSNAKPSNFKEVLDHNTTTTSKSTELTVPADYETDALRAELKEFGEMPGPITKSTKRLYLKRLIKYKRKPYAMIKMLTEYNANKIKFSVELHHSLRSLESYQRIQEYMKYEKLLSTFFANAEKRQMREGHLKHSFIYMLIDPRISCNLPGETVLMDKIVVWKRFLESIFYVGKGKTSRPYSHLYDAIKTHSRLQMEQQQEQNKENSQQNPFGRKVSVKKHINVELFKSPPKRSSDNKKIDRILNIWANENGVVCLHVFHNICPTDAFTREAAIIDALSLRHLTNMKRGDYYGPAQNWTMKEKKFLGIALLYKALQIYLAEGESQLSPSDLIK